jgi:hypothetical protein
MRSLVRLTGPALLVFLAGAVTANVPGLEAKLTAGVGAEASGLLLGALAVAMFSALIVATIGAAIHFRQNSTLAGPRRTMWYAVLWIPMVGAVAYYLRSMRRGT